MACRPDEQNRLIVIADDSTGKPARSDAIRATFIPCSPSGMAQPRITSSICRGSSPFARDTASLMATAARSSGRVARSVPFGALPTAVRTELTITASRIRHLNLDLHGNEPNALDAAAMEKATAGVRSGYFGDRIPVVACGENYRRNWILINSSTSTGLPSSWEGSYFHLRSASRAAWRRIIGPETTFICPTLPLLLTCVSIRTSP